MTTGSTSYYSVGPRSVVQQIITSELQYKTINAGESVGQWEVVFQDGQFIRQAAADQPSRMDGVGLARNAVGSGIAVDVVIRGRLTNTSWTWTSGSALYVSPTTSGGMTHTIPTTSGHVIQRMGLALTATQMELNPQRGYIIAE